MLLNQNSLNSISRLVAVDVADTPPIPWKTRVFTSSAVSKVMRYITIGFRFVFLSSPFLYW